MPIHGIVTALTFGGAGPSGFVLRGGSWNNNPQNAASSVRLRNDPDNINNNDGFRVVLCASTRFCPFSGGAAQN